MNADISPRKRSFVDAVGQEAFTNSDFLERHEDYIPFVTSPDRRTRSIPFPTKRRSISISRPSSMPVETTPFVVPPTFPSFMSVYGGVESSLQDNARRNSLPAKAQHSSRGSLSSTNTEPGTYYPLASTLKHQASINSLTSDSTESSPTTTVSTFDSPSVTDPSPSSSPESPFSALPLSPFRAMMSSPDEPHKNDENTKISFASSISNSQPALESPNFGGRNVKNLSLNMTVASPTRPTISSGLDGFHPLSSPISPLRDPLRTGRKKPTNLTIRTPGFDQLTFVRTAPDVPPTPSQRPPLPHYQSSPVLPSLMTPSIGPAGGMRLPLSIPGSAFSRPISQSSFSNHSVVGNSRDTREEEHIQPQKSQETQERGYPHGPIKVYDSGVYLYLEPTVQEASQFDTVINVAKEINNPFEWSQNQAGRTVMSVWRNEPDRSRIPEPLTAISEVSFKSAFEWPQSNEFTTPTTPRPASRVPEYVHVPWDHSSEIIDDLFPLCELIETRVKSGKTVLIHCQLGVSRSASLVIAYGLYKGYQPDFHSMYSTLKERSQWVGPNMSLIYQLGDFRRQVEKGEHIQKRREPPEEWFSKIEHGYEITLTPTLSAPPPVPEKEQWMQLRPMQSDPPFVPKIATPLRLNKKLPPVPLFDDSQIKPMHGAKSRSQAVPDSAPSNADLPTTSSTALPTPSTKTTPAAFPSPSLLENEMVSNLPTSLPLSLYEQLRPKMDIPPHRPRSPGFSQITIIQSSPEMDLAMQDVPTSPSLFSPRATEFMASPFAPTIAGDLLIGSRISSGFPSDNILSPSPSHAQVDPRSPHQKDEPGEILRHIDDFL